MASTEDAVRHVRSTEELIHILNANGPGLQQVKARLGLDGDGESLGAHSCCRDCVRLALGLANNTSVKSLDLSSSNGCLFMAAAEALKLN
eukprot:CAMPEP_0115167038 /NCGR_PEP_ID=MMETSP0227-20121206/74436_1 /TAXON_ID=89957 /ORGANISM="Polarella glacialis, Strain CCMP 1383" /LENGTH=89 /DNA_ID=CAMNT_0002579597 /DNA_START=107 /DNA_END=373 /DNA_ORIENTATION=-